MPSYAAGPRPATVRLAQTSSQCIKETFNRYLPLPSSATRPANSVAPKPQIIARNRVRPRRSHKPSRSNLHSAPQPPASLTAVSFPGGFRTPAPVQAASSRWAVIRNPSQTRHIHDVRAMSACAPTPEVSLRRGEPTRWAMNDPCIATNSEPFRRSLTAVILYAAGRRSPITPTSGAAPSPPSDRAYRSLR